MTEEQIEQKAEEYASLYWDRDNAELMDTDNVACWKDVVQDYIAGYLQALQDMQRQETISGFMEAYACTEKEAEKMYNKKYSVTPSDTDISHIG